MYTPRWQTKSSRRAIASARSPSWRSYGRRHIGKPRAELVVVHADERIAIQQIDVVVDDHHVAGGEVRIQPAGRVGDDQQLDAERLHHADRKRGPLGRVAFVAVEAALHGDDRHAGEPAAQAAGP